LVLILVPVVIVLIGAGAAFATGSLSFTDVADNAHQQSILNMANRGITTGYPDGTFRPDQSVTRGQMMTFLDRYTSGMGCTDCHNSSSLLLAKEHQYSLSLHGSGEAWEEETRAACAGCHGGDGPKARMDAGLLPHDASIPANVNAAPMNCRNCHSIHDTYTGADWVLTGAEKAVKMEYTDGTFDKGAGNLCANCHQVRNAKPAVADGKITVAQRFGTHYGTEASMMLGEGGLGGVAGSPSVHYKYVDDSCVACHMGKDDLHEFEPALANCTGCHADLKNFDRNGVQTEIKAMLAQVKEGLLKAKIMNAADELAVAGSYPEKIANAFWNYKIVAYDGSNGVHNYAYAKALLQYAIDALK
jgi:hypothetical protein